MKTIFMYSIVTGVIAGILVILSSFKKGLKKIVLPGLGAVAAGFLLEFLMLYIFMPSFAHWTSGGYILTAIVALISAIIFSFVVHKDSLFNKDLNGAEILAIAGVGARLLILVVSYFLVPPAIFNNKIWDDIAALANVRMQRKRTCQFQPLIVTC